MKQYLVEVPDEAKIVESTNTLIFDAAPAAERTCRRVKNARLYTEDRVQEISNESLKCGHEEAWELAKKIMTDVDNGGYSCNDLRAIFEKSTMGYAMGYAMCVQIIKENTYDEAIQKIQAWEEEKKTIHVGDVFVSDITGKKAVVCGIDHDVIQFLRANGTCDKGRRDAFIELYKKTGETIAFADILDQLNKEA